jgi:hypothetical protein
MKKQCCHICQSQDLVREDLYSSLKRVTSDCKPWPNGGELAVCQNCGIAQAPWTERWQKEAQEIYKSYTIYHQSGGREQSIFDPTTGTPVARSLRLLNKVVEDIGLPRSGRLLDVGCGNGQLLRNASGILPGWKLSGLEYDDRHRGDILSIKGAEGFYTGEISDVPGSFNLITLVHVLEHLTDPRATLKKLWEKLAPGGLLIIDVPDFTKNPFILLVADHCTHFETATLTELVSACGFAIAGSSEDWVPKESVVIARKNEATPSHFELGSGHNSAAAIHEAIAWISQVANQARQTAQLGKFGIFGTSIGATFLRAELDDETEFFLDEDPHRIGKTHLGLPIYHPSSASKGSHVFVPLAPQVTEQIVKRHGKNGNFTLHWAEKEKLTTHKT